MGNQPPGVLSPKKGEAKNPGCHDERLIVENAPTLMATVDAKPKRSRATGPKGLMLANHRGEKKNGVRTRIIAFRISSQNPHEKQFLFLHAVTVSPFSPWREQRLPTSSENVPRTTIPEKNKNRFFFVRISPFLGAFYHQKPKANNQK